MAERLNVLVTGASSGIGRAAACELASRGHNVFLGARRRTELEELARTSERMKAVPLDVTDPDSVRAAAGRVDELTAGHGIDVLLNSAGYALGGPVEALSGEAVQHQFQTNVFGPVSYTHLTLPTNREV